MHRVLARCNDCNRAIAAEDRDGEISAIGSPGCPRCGGDELFKEPSCLVRAYASFSVMGAQGLEPWAS